MPSRIKNASTSLIAAGTLALALLGASAGVASMQDGQFQAQDRQGQEREEELRVGTYEPQRAFQGSRFGHMLNERMERLQAEFQQALEAGNQERAGQIQQQVQMVQNEVVQEFLGEVEKAMPEVAAEAGVSLVALEVVYIDPKLKQPKDLTEDIIEQLNGGADNADQPE